MTEAKENKIFEQDDKDFAELLAKIKQSLEQKYLDNEYVLNGNDCLFIFPKIGAKPIPNFNQENFIDLLKETGVSLKGHWKPYILNFSMKCYTHEAYIKIDDGYNAGDLKFIFYVNPHPLENEIAQYSFTLFYQLEGIIRELDGLKDPGEILSTINYISGLNFEDIQAIFCSDKWSDENYLYIMCSKEKVFKVPFGTGNLKVVEGVLWCTVSEGFGERVSIVPNCLEEYKNDFLDKDNIVKPGHLIYAQNINSMEEYATYNPYNPPTERIIKNPRRIVINDFKQEVQDLYNKSKKHEADIFS